jgi:methylase of polypeptide subunit release factors
MRSQTADNILNRISKKETPYFYYYKNLKIKINKNVYPPSQESLMIAEVLEDKEYKIKNNAKVLDYGTGSGFLALVAASLGAKVIATDINSNSIECAKFNVQNNNLSDSIEIRHGNGFSVIREEEKFDVILANLPYEDADINNEMEYSVYDPDFQMRKDLFENAEKHLNKYGKIFFTYSERAEKIKPIESFSDKFNYKIIKKKLIDNEIYLLYGITLK